jgi:hypothetical protein
MANGTIDLSPGITGLFDALGGSRNTSRALQYQAQVQRGDLASAQAELAREKIREAIAERERRARLEKPEALDDILTAIGGVDPAQASAARRHFSGDPLRLPSDPGAAPVAEVPGQLGGDMGDFGETISRQPNIRPEGLTDESLKRLGRIFGAFRGANVAGGKVDDIGQAIKSLLGADLTEEQAGLARAGDPSTISRQNRLGAASRGAAHEPFGSSSFGPYSQETGTLPDRSLFEAEVGKTGSEAGAARALAGSRGASQRQTELETSNLQTSGLKEPGRGRNVRGGANEPVYERKKRDWLSLYPGDNKGALEYASGQRPFRASDARKLAAVEARAKGLTGDQYNDYITDATEEIIARNKGDDEGVARIRLRNATSSLRDRAKRVKRLNPEKQVAEVQAIAAELKGKGFDAEEIKAILANAGLGD